MQDESDSTHREHKVHNIVLYPDKQSWCKTTAIKQVVTSPGFKQTTIDNNVCVGACFSYSIPRTQPAEPGELIVPYCDSCQPVTTRCYHVTLQADSDNVDGPKTIQKRVQIITNCTCLSCEKTVTTDCEMLDENTAELPTDLFSIKDNESTKDTADFFVPPNQQTDDVPELLRFLPNKTRTNAHNLNFDVTNVKTKQQKYEINAKLIALLKSIQDQDDDSPNFNYDKAQLRELLNIIEGSEHQLSDKNLMEFVNFVNVHNSEDLELDLSRLKEVLTNFQDSQELAERHRHFGLGKADGSHVGLGLDMGHLGIHHLKGSHINMNTHDNDGITKNTLDETSNVKHFEKKHYLGERQKIVTQVGLGHLIKGPHGSLVVAEDHPSGVDEKLNVEPHLLKPNHAGMELSYENNSKKQNTLKN
ncbi:hypothetical protein CBL_13140 [Carabus blaptoides fortunei]